MVGLIVHEWLAKAGGSERVLDEFIRAYPDSDLQVLWNDTGSRYPVPAHESWLARTPLRHHKALALPFIPGTWRSLPRLNSYEWILVSSHLFAHHARLRGRHQPPKLVYTHTPARYIWAPEDDPRGRIRAARIASPILRRLDRRRAVEAVAIAANSEFTRMRVQQAWDRDARVIYPPVDVDRITRGGNWADNLTQEESDILQALPTGFLLGASRFVDYKRLDAVITAGSATGLPIVLAGDGPLRSYLEELARSSPTNVSFVIQPSDSLLFALYQKAIALVFPAVEDFGIMPIEAMAAGTPVIVRDRGGAHETVIASGGGVVVDINSPSSWREGVADIARVDRVTLPSRVGNFAPARFRSEIDDWMRSWL